MLLTCVGVMAPMLAFMPASVAATPGVDPSSVTLTLAEGTSSHVSKVVHTPAIPPKPDVLILADTTGSMGSTLSSLKTNLNNLVNQVTAAQPDAQFGVADYRDFNNCPVDGYAYRLDQPITANTAAVQTAVNGYSASGGCDTPEQQLNALFQIATDNPPVGWRSGSTRIVAWFGDSSGHDPSFGHTLSDVINELKGHGIEVIAVPINSGLGDGLNSTGQASAISSATGGSLVASSAPNDVTNAIVSGLKNLPVTVQPTTSGCDPHLTVSWNPATATVTSGNDAPFDETIAVGSTATPGTTLLCTVAFLLNGQPAGPQFNENITVTVPKHNAVLTVTNASSDFHDPGTVSATLRDASTSAPITGQSVSFTLNGTESCAGTTLADGSVSCSMTPGEQAGSYPLKATFAGDAQHNATTGSASYAVTLEETTLKYTSPTPAVLAANGATLTAALTEDGTTPINGRSVTIKLSDGTAAQSCTATTNASGTASCTISPITVALGNDTITATFAGDPFYRPSSDTAKAIVFAFPSSGAFVVGDKTSTGHVDFWGSQWTKTNVLSTGPAPDAFKGFAATTSQPPANGKPWSTDPGNSPPPPSNVPSYMGVIVASQTSQTGSTISGNTVHIVVVKTDPGYASDPGHRGTGTVVATFS